MRHLKKLVLILFAASSLGGCKVGTSENHKTESGISGEVQVYYFHTSMRCAACNAVENETRVALELYYKEKMEDGTIEFISLNLEEENGKTMAETLRVAGPTLLIVKGENRVNFTNEGFMNARPNPAKFHEMIKAQIDKLL